MNKGKNSVSLKCFGLFLLPIIISYGLFPMMVFAQSNELKMQAHFINAGQADATLLEFPCGAVLVDAGAQDEEHERALMRYLDNFFRKRTDLGNKLDVIIVTHPHIDHNRVLRKVVAKYPPKVYIDNGQRKGSGAQEQIYMRKKVRKLRDTKYVSMSFKSIIRGGNKNGLTNELVDPLDCGDVDPIITFISGRFGKPGKNWNKDDFEENENNHSVVLRVDFGDSSFLFTGDLEEEGIESMLKYYGLSSRPRSNNILDADVFQVGHHGAKNATTRDLLAAITPEIAIISCGKYTYDDHPDRYDTFHYGHPRKQTLDLLSEVIQEERSPRTVKVGTATKTFKNYSLRKRIYSTSWDKTVVIIADAKGNYGVTTE